MKARQITCSQFRSTDLDGGPAAGVNKYVEVLMHAVEQPEEELLCVMLGITSELRSTLGHDVLQKAKWNRQQGKRWRWVVSTELLETTKTKKKNMFKKFNIY